MQLKKWLSVVPGAIGVMITLALLFVQTRVFNVIAWDYNVCHLVFGFTFPFFLSYLGIPAQKVEVLPLREVINRIAAVPVINWPLQYLRAIGRGVKRDFIEGLPWTPWMGVALTLCLSIGNEMIVDPATNGIPFTSAYGNFVADVLGMVLFLCVAQPFVRRAKQAATSLV